MKNEIYFNTTYKVSNNPRPYIKPTVYGDETNKCIEVVKSIFYYILYTLCFLHVSATIVVILS
jgi:hypothetical protein